MRLVDLTGRRFGWLLVTGRWPINADNGDPLWECQCHCGNSKLVRGRYLRRGESESCGCQKGRNHGREGTKEYNSWHGMIQRCENPRNKKYPLYGGRGITICEQWRHSFAAFLDDVGLAPSRIHSIDRIDVNGHYEPGNVRWADSMTQRHNRRDTKEMIYG